jgi:hypothetical protein
MFTLFVYSDYSIHVAIFTGFQMHQVLSINDANDAFLPK